MFAWNNSFPFSIGSC